jgi:hypothetical protein
MTQRKFTQEELARARAGDFLLSDRAAIEAQVKEEQRVAKAKRDEANRELDASRWQRFVAKVKRERQEDAERLKGETEAINAMTPQEYDRWQKNQPPADLAPRVQKGVGIALGDLATEAAKERNRTLAAREQELELPRLQREHSESVDAYRLERRISEDEAKALIAAARERENEQLAALGDCPSLELIESQVPS